MLVQLMKCHCESMYAHGQLIMYRQGGWKESQKGAILQNNSQSVVFVHFLLLMNVL
jgi:hypothetical protein